MPLRLQFFLCFLAAAATSGVFTYAFFPAAPLTTAPCQGAPPSFSSKWSPDVNGLSFTGSTTPPRSGSQSSSSSRSLHVLHSAKVIPYAFRSVSVALVIRAANTMSRSTTDAAVLLATAFLGLFNFPKLDNDRLKSAKRAIKRLEKSDAAGAENDDLVKARAYKSAVRTKILLQFLGLLYIAGWANTGRKVVMGTAAVIASTVVFLYMGGARWRHNTSGRLAPIEPKYFDIISVIGAAVAAAFLESRALWRTIAAGYVALGCVIGALDGIAFKKAKSEDSTVTP